MQKHFHFIRSVEVINQHHIQVSKFKDQILIEMIPEVCLNHPRMYQDSLAEKVFPIALSNRSISQLQKTLETLPFEDICKKLEGMEQQTSRTGIGTLTFEDDRKPTRKTKDRER